MLLDTERNEKWKTWEKNFAPTHIHIIMQNSILQTFTEECVGIKSMSRESFQTHTKIIINAHFAYFSCPVYNISGI